MLLATFTLTSALAPGVGVAEDDALGVAVGDAECVGVAVGVGVAEPECVAVGVGVGAAEPEGLAVGVALGAMSRTGGATVLVPPPPHAASSAAANVSKKTACEPRHAIREAFGSGSWRFLATNCDAAQIASLCDPLLLTKLPRARGHRSEPKAPSDTRPDRETTGPHPASPALQGRSRRPGLPVLRRFSSTSRALRAARAGSRG